MTYISDDTKETAKTLAGLLLEIEAIKLQPEKPFTWTSGLKSPIYCDNRKVLSHPSVRNFVRDTMIKLIREKYSIGYNYIDDDIFIASVATGAIGIGSIIADHLGLPAVYVRPEPKKHGLENQVEGDIDALKKAKLIIFIEDLISTGKSSINAFNAVRELGCEVNDMFANFTYGFEESKQALSDASVNLHALCDFQTLCEVASEFNYIEQSQLELVKSFASEPKNWKAA